MTHLCAGALWEASLRNPVLQPDSSIATTAAPATDVESMTDQLADLLSPKAEPTPTVVFQYGKLSLIPLWP